MVNSESALLSSLSGYVLCNVLGMWTSYVRICAWLLLSPVSSAEIVMIFFVCSDDEARGDLLG